VPSVRLTFFCVYVGIVNQAAEFEGEKVILEDLRVVIFFPEVAQSKVYGRKMGRELGDVHSPKRRKYLFVVKRGVQEPFLKICLNEEGAGAASRVHNRIFGRVFQREGKD